MPKISASSNKSQSKIIYPPGVREISEDVSTDDLVRRLKDCAQAFQNMSQDDDNTYCIPLALHLASECFLEHSSKDVRLLIACCVADVFRVFAPDAPYKDPDQLKVIFEFFIQELQGLEDPKDPIFKRYFYLLENLAWVKSFNICIELEDNQSIFCQLFNLIFTIVNDNHSTKVKNFMLDMMCPLITEADTVSQELLDIILAQIIEPKKTQNKNSYHLAQDVLKRTTSTIEPYIQAFFNNALILGKTSQSEVAQHLYELIYELNAICPSMLVAVLPQLEFKLKSNEEKERLEVTRLLARMFSDRNSVLAAENKPLWNCFLGRFNDISVQVRMRCVQYSMHFLLNHPELKTDITEQLRQRQHDPEENVRYEVVMAIISAAKKDFSSVNEELLNFVKERTLDKKFKIRKEALLGLALLYKQHMSSLNLPLSTLECISWIKNKVLHVYYQTALEDRLLVERILHTCLVPYQSPLEERMKKLYQLFSTVDDYAVKAFNELLKCQNVVRLQVRSVLETLSLPKDEERDKNLSNRIAVLSKNMSEPVKAQEYFQKFCIQLENNPRVRAHMDVIIQGSASCTEAEVSVKEVLKSLGFPVQTNSYYMTVKQMLERVAPVMIDRAGIKHIILIVKDALLDGGVLESQLGLANSVHRGLQLLHTLSYVFPATFYGEEVFSDLLQILQADDEISADLCLQILINVADDIERDHPIIAMRLLPVLESFIELGTVKQAKHAVVCMNVIVSNKERVFGQVIDHLKKHLTLQSPYFRTALVSIGHIAYQCPELFGLQIKSIVSKVVVKDLLMLDQSVLAVCSLRRPSSLHEDLPRGGDDTWGPLDSLPEETKVKIEGMKLMVRWLIGLRTAVQSAVSTLRLLSTLVLHHGDLMERQHAAPMEKAWLRITAASCILKLCQEPAYAEAMTLDQFQTLALVAIDECYEVREKFIQKLNKGLIALRLPLDFLAVIAFGGIESCKELKMQLKQHLLSNINKRRDFLKQHPYTTVKLFSLLPDYVLPYTIHLLAHDPSFKKYDDVPSLLRLKDCLWFLMEPLIMKNENYSFSFFKRLIENIKQTKDKQSPNDDLANLKLYAVCDLALGLVMSKTTNFVLKDFPVEPSLPSKLFTDLDKSYSNLKSYLPPELAFTPPKRSCIEMEMMGLPQKGVIPNTVAPMLPIPSKKSNFSVKGVVNPACDLNTGTRAIDKPPRKIKQPRPNSLHKRKGPYSRIPKNKEEAENKAPQNGQDIPGEIVKRPRGRPRKYPLPSDKTVSSSVPNTNQTLTEINKLNNFNETTIEQTVILNVTGMPNPSSTDQPVIKKRGRKPKIRILEIQSSPSNSGENQTETSKLLPNSFVPQHTLQSSQNTILTNSSTDIKSSTSSSPLLSERKHKKTKNKQDILTSKKVHVSISLANTTRKHKKQASIRRGPGRPPKNLHNFHKNKQKYSSLKAHQKDSSSTASECSSPNRRPRGRPRKVPINDTQCPLPQKPGSDAEHHSHQVSSTPTSVNMLPRKRRKIVHSPAASLKPSIKTSTPLQSSLKTNPGKSALTPSLSRIHGLRKTIKLTRLANGTDHIPLSGKISTGKNQSPGKKRYTAAALLAQAIRSSSFSVRSNTNVRRGVKRRNQ